MAYSEGDDGYPLHWEVDGPITVEQHYLGGGGMPIALLQGAARNALLSWADLAGSDVSFEEQWVGLGRPCPHGLPASHADRADDVCGGPVEEVDGASTLFFMDSIWPFATEAIALTTVSYAAEGQIVDADIAFNGVDYDWTVGNTDVHTDYESIALHEVGHLLGLDHSQVQGAVMVLEYDQGSVNRELSDDDAEGLASLYPCSGPACRGVVDYVSSGCSVVDPGAAGLVERRGESSRRALLWLVLVAVSMPWRRSRCGRSRRGRSRLVKGVVTLVLAIGLGSLMPSSSYASTVLFLSVDDLTDRSEVVLRGTVVDRSFYRDGIVWNRVIVEVSACWRGDCGEFVELVQPGGWIDGFGTRAFGMPTLRPGEEAILFLSSSSKGSLRVVGLTQGHFRVAEDGSISRDLEGMHLVRPGRHHATDAEPRVQGVSVPSTARDLFERVVRR